MVNAEEIFKISMALADSLGPDGGSDIPDNIEYRRRCLPIINSLVPELYLYSLNFLSAISQLRPSPEEIKSFTEALPLDESIARGVLPYGLASALLMAEDPRTAAFFQSRYDSLKASLRYGIRAESDETEEVYGGFAYNSFGRW